MNKIPTFTSAICKTIVLPKASTFGPQGITEPVINAVNIAIPGPKINNHLSEFKGMKSSLKNILVPSANG